jgi:hypothetical protein
VEVVGGQRRVAVAEASSQPNSPAEAETAKHASRGTLRNQVALCPSETRLIRGKVNSSAHGQRAATLANPQSDLKGFNLTVDSLTQECGGEPTFAVADLASFYGRNRTVGDVLRRYAAPVPVAGA